MRPVIQMAASTTRMIILAKSNRPETSVLTTVAGMPKTKLNPAARATASRIKVKITRVAGLR